MQHKLYRWNGAEETVKMQGFCQRLLEITNEASQAYVATGLGGIATAKILDDTVARIDKPQANASATGVKGSAVGG